MNEIDKNNWRSTSTFQTLLGKFQQSNFSETTTKLQSVFALLSINYPR